ncbi:MAG TPA: flagellar biosynthesis protein FlhF [Bacillota bacterium]|nr:flagellar biosynthesis protein FlhF [Bacillota bacterium]
MRVKRYEGSTMKDALDQVRQELGPDAVILEARRSRGRGLGALLSILGFGKAPVFEVMAAADGDDGGGRDGDGASGFTAVTWVPSPLTARAKAETADEAQAEATEPALQASAQTMTGPTMQVVTPPRMPEVPLAPAISPSGPLATLKVLEREAAVRARAAGLSPEMADLYAHLVDEDVAEDVAFAVVHQLGMADAPQLETEQFREWASEHAAGLVRTSGPIQIVRDRRKVVAFIGPTGVGKTTTIAKIAAGFALFAKARVALVTADTYRIAAIEQIRSYAEIIGIPCEVVHSPKDMEEVLAGLADYELVLIDTAGRSPNNPARMYELRNMIDAAMPEEIHLVLSSTTRRRDLDNLVDRFAAVGFDRVILTKMDESMTFGAIFNVHAKCAKPFSYFTNGQSVPEDIDTATQSQVARMVLAKWRIAGGL